jgi:hypothetical protein
MRSHLAGRSLPGILAVALAATLSAQEIPVTNWTVPAFRSATGGLTPMSDVTQGTSFVGMEPCRIVDTRNPAGPYGGPALAANVARVFDLDNGPCTGIPAFGVEAYSLSFGGIVPPGNGFLTAWPTGSAQPTISQLNMIAGEVLANAAIVPSGTSGAINVLVSVGPTHIYIDINGYFTNFLNPGVALVAIGDVAGGGIVFGHNTNGVAANSTGVYGRVGSPISILGCCGPAGVRGESPHVGVVGLGRDIGVAGRIYNSDGNVLAGGELATPVTSTITYGVQGASLTSGTGSAGVKGVDYSGEPNPGFVCCGIAGVRGVSLSNTGVDGVSRDGVGVVGWNKDGAGSTLAWGALGVNDALGIAFANGIAGTGTKSFVEPHPADASKAIRYVSLEGNEAGTYFRGRGRFERGLARIAVPEDFRIVTDPDGLTVQITPIGEMASYAVVKAGLDEIVVKASRNVEFFYAVNGVRRAYKGWQPIVSSEEFFMPESADQKLPAYFGEEERRRLITNGTYRPDGTVNMETAERLGWTRTWERRRTDEEAAAKNAQARVSRADTTGLAP